MPALDTPPAPGLAAPDLAALVEMLDHALALDGPARDAFLAALPPATRAALAPLLRDALADDPLLDHPAAALASLAADATTDSVAEGVRVGPYRLGALVGEGGMGRVFRAHRADGAFDQTVALKVVRQSLALAGADVAARLRRERDLLAALDHPGIARLLDGGETDDGVPYLVTEFVDGPPLTTWADDHRLGIPDRVRLLMEVAQAVEHAHRRFVVHRDLKPSNVLVTERDGTPRPVVLDFGIAKLLAGAEEEGTAAFPLTRTGLRLLTPAYAAPELYEPGVTVTTAADVYGLGALLYELLTGCRPHEDNPAPGGPPTTEPTRPSRVVATRPAGPYQPPEPTARARALRGDLDTICLKALHPDPVRRYASAADLADDLARHLDGRPVEARPDSLAYVAGRFVRRHRATVAAAALALLALVGGLGTSLVLLSREQAARVESEASARRATEAATLLAGLFQTANPLRDGNREATVLQAVEEGVRQVRLVESDSLRAYLLRILGETYIGLGEPTVADSLLQEALAIHGTDAHGDEPSRVRQALISTRDALSDYEGVLVLTRHLYRDHRDDVDPSIANSALRFMARAYSSLGQHARAIELATHARDVAQAGGSPSQRAQTSSQLGELLAAAGRLTEAPPYLQEWVDWTEAAYGRTDWRTLAAMVSLGDVLGQMGRVEEAEAALLPVIAVHTERYGAQRVIHPVACLGIARLRAGQFRRAAALLDSAITRGTPVYSPHHQDIGYWLTLRAEAVNGYGDHTAAEAVARQALAVAEVQLPRARPLARGRALGQLGTALLGQGRHAEAETVLREALDLLTSSPNTTVRPEEVATIRAALGRGRAGA
ncbi:MAG TPA: serine/threonine-protein kinase [Rhodothermales bacterium]|nr:serine/threonine-protein kinase [Rhodothermales bacterium]